MRFTALAICSLSVLPVAAQEILSPADREALLETLDELRNSADARVDARFRQAIAAYRQAMSSETAALDFYVKCLEKVDFEDKMKKSADFREWRRKEGEQLGDPALRRALLHQLRWLVLTLQAASSNPDQGKLAADAKQIVDAIFDDARNLKGQQNVLQQGVLGTVFARAYDIKDVKLDKWPQSPLQLQEVYDKILLPPYRSPTRVDSLRSAWKKRIEQESIRREHWAREDRQNQDRENKRIGTKESMRPPEYELFLVEGVPELQWEMEKDVFTSGDQRGAALNMIDHLKKHSTHPKVRTWNDEFKKLLTSDDGAAGEGTL